MGGKGHRQDKRDGDGHRRRRLLASLLVAACVAIPAGADVIPPGHRTIPSRTMVEGLDGFPGWAFFAYPTRISDGSVRVRQGVPVTFYKFASPYLYAARLPVPDEPDRAFFERPEVARSKDRLAGGGARTVPESDRRSGITTTYRVKAINGKVIDVEVAVKETTRSAWVRPPAAALLGLAGVGLVGLLVVRRRT